MLNKEQLENIILRGETDRFHGGQKEEEIKDILGLPLCEKRSRKQLVLQYGQAGFVLISGGLKQINIAADENVDAILGENKPELETADEVPGVFLCKRVINGGNNETLLSMFPETGKTLSLTLVFSERLKRLDLEIQEGLYEKLKSISAKTRKNIKELCMEAIKLYCENV